jgi:hypothetical protein
MTKGANKCALVESTFEQKSATLGWRSRWVLTPARHLLMGARFALEKVGTVQCSCGARVIHLNSRFQLFVCYEKQACKLPGRCVATPGPKWLVTI